MENTQPVCVHLIPGAFVIMGHIIAPLRFHIQI